MVGTQEAVALQGEPASQPKAPPWPVVAFALIVGIALVGGTTMGGYLLSHQDDASVAESPARSEPAVPADAPTPIQGNEPITGRRAWLKGQSCDTACIGGALCAAKPLECTSGLSCVPGTGAEAFEPQESWLLHLSAVQEADGVGGLVDPCSSKKDFWVCRSGTAVCMSQADACANAGRSTAGVPITGAEVGQLGLVLDVRFGGARGPVVATTSAIRNLRRGGLCRGFRVNARGGSVAAVSYFLLPP